MTYSSAYFEHPDQSLKDAQAAKFDRLCQQLMFNHHDRVLEIGTGWGGLAVHAAKNYGCHVTSITISRQQYKWAKQRVVDEGLSKYVDVQLCDYRDMKGSFDKIVSVEMIEAVGHRYYSAFFKACQNLLAKKGMMGLQMILCPDSRYESFKTNVDWIQKHIFPGSLLPCVTELQTAIRKTGNLWLYNFEDMTAHYVRTLRLWRQAFWANIDQVRGLGLDESFIRKWNYYLCYCEAAFNRHNISVAQAIYTRPNQFHFLPQGQDHNLGVQHPRTTRGPNRARRGQ
jgi:cyclopropane-fatty-acyl-phospholipid synthase